MKKLFFTTFALIIAAHTGAQETDNIPYILTEVEDNVYAVTMTDEEIATTYPKEWVDNAWELGVKIPVGTVMFENDEILITAGCGTPVYVEQPEGVNQPGGNRLSDIHEHFPNYTGYVNGGSSIPEKHWTGNEELYTIVDAVTDNHGIPFVYPKVNGTLKFGAFAGDNSRSIGIYEWPTDAEIEEQIPGHWIDYSNFRNDGGALDVSDAMVEISVGELNAPEYVEGKVTVGRVYALIAGGKRNVNIHQITFIPDTETSIKDIATSTTAAPTSGKIYSIDGRYVGSDKADIGKGIYIMDGKKFVVR